MVDESWQRRNEWTAEFEEIFDDKVKRMRTHKAGAFATQAQVLYNAGDFDNSLMLSERGLAESGTYLRPLEASFLHRLAGAVYTLRGDFELAEQAFVAAARADPPRTDPRTGLLKRFGSRGGADPETCLARLLYRQGREPGEIWPDWAKTAAKADIMPDHPWRAVDLNNEALTDPEDAAEWLVISHDVSDHLDAPGAVDALYAADREALVVLDRLIAAKVIPGFALWHFHHVRYLPWLGSYIGRVLVRQGNTWVRAEHLTEHRVETSDGLVDTFALAWETLVLGKPLTRVLP